MRARGGCTGRDGSRNGRNASMIRRLLLCILLAAPALFGADKTADKMLELQRDVSGLQEQLKALQKSLEDSLAALGQKNAEQARAAAEQNDKAITALGDRLQKGLQDLQDRQTKSLDAVAGLGAQVQAEAGDLSTMKNALGDLTAAMTGLTTQLADLSAAVKSMQAPKPDPSAEPARPVLSATDLWNSAEDDRHSGKLDLALKEYTAYVSQFADTDQAPDAQYYIGSLHYSNEEWDDAVKAFDAVLQTYPDSKRVPEALYYKGYCLGKLGRWPEAAETLKDLRRRFPTHALAKQSAGIKPSAKQ
jgi:TolA-binding protein